MLVMIYYTVLGYQWLQHNMLKYSKDINGDDILLEVCEKGVSQVMMAWEKPYMEACINKLKPKGHVLEVGFGMGYSATQIQKYNPSQFYKAWHFETNGTAGLIGNRFLVFMAYLNTVQKGGQTEYLYQKKKFKAEEGKLLIWPAYWTHTHRGCVAPKETKYIITGWWTYER